MKPEPADAASAPRFRQETHIPSKLTLDSFVASPMTNAYVRFEGLEVYVTKIRLIVDGEVRSALARSNTKNPRRPTNLHPDPRMKSNGQYGRLDEAMVLAARECGMDGVAVQGVCNRFLPEVLVRYGYRKIDENSGFGSFYKTV